MERDYKRFAYLRFYDDNGKLKNIYVVDRYLFLGYILVSLMFVVAYMLLNNGFTTSKYLFVECNIPHATRANISTANGFIVLIADKCLNPFYNNTAYCGKTINASSPICTTQFLQAGASLGIRPPPIMLYFDSTAIILLLILFIINHFLYNHKSEVLK